MPNRLAASTSPYLLQHAENPVDWYPWGEEAFLRAKLENKPIFLSVGYSSCHWCHVMAHESFEDGATAQLLNDSFICIKVDREERPDVDEAYMTAVQLTSGRGGWPMSAFLTPDKRPFFAGTYFPPEDRGQVPGFKTLIRQLAMAWRSRRTEVEGAAREIERALLETLGARLPGTFTAIDNNFLNTAVHTLLGDFDPVNGGFGAAPKFPPHSAIELLIAFSMRQSAPEELRSAALTAALFTLERMCQGGIRDHVGGGFHRYSTDAEWKLPHFEKMLYDNGLILSNLVQGAFLATHLEGANAEFLFETASEAATWLVREMRGEDGTFYSAIDADSEGEEGRYYTWTPEAVMELLGPDAEAFLDTYQFTPEGNFNDEATGETTGRNIPFLLESLPKGAFLDSKRTLLRAREHRERPLVDHKALVAWNGIVIGALADAGQIQLAATAAAAILGYAEEHGRLPHMVTNGVPMGEAFLDDYAHFCDGLIRLALAMQAANQGGEEFAGAAGALANEMVAQFRDEASGAFYSTSSRHEDLFGRTIPVFDQPIPSGNAIAIRVLAQLGRIEEASKALSALAGWMERAPGATESLLLTALYVLPDEAEEEVVEPAAPAIPIAEAKLTAKLSEREAQTDAAGVARVAIQVSVPEGMHLNSERPPARWLTPTEVRVNGVKASIAYPTATNDRFEGSFSIGLELALPAGARDAEYEATLSYQLCTETECLPSTEFRLSGVIFR